MGIQQQRTVDVLAVDVADDYSLDLTARDILTGDEVVVSLSWEEAYEHANEVLEKLSDAKEAFEEDRVAKSRQQRPSVNGFDRDVPLCRDCREGKHGACIGSAYVERDGEIAEVACGCTADGHRGRS